MTRHRTKQMVSDGDRLVCALAFSLSTSMMSPVDATIQELPCSFLLVLKRGRLQCTVKKNYSEVKNKSLVDISVERQMLENVSRRSLSPFVMQSFTFDCISTANSVCYSSFNQSQ